MTPMMDENEQAMIGFMNRFRGAFEKVFAEIIAEINTPEKPDRVYMVKKDPQTYLDYHAWDDKVFTVEPSISPEIQKCLDAPRPSPWVTKIAFEPTQNPYEPTGGL